MLRKVVQLVPLSLYNDPLREEEGLIAKCRYAYFVKLATKEPLISLASRKEKRTRRLALFVSHFLFCKGEITRRLANMQRAPLLSRPPTRSPLFLFTRLIFRVNFWLFRFLHRLLPRFTVHAVSSATKKTANQRNSHLLLMLRSRPNRC